MFGVYKQAPPPAAVGGASIPKMTSDALFATHELVDAAAKKPPIATPRTLLMVSAMQAPFVFCNSVPGAHGQRQKSYPPRSTSEGTFRTSACPSAVTIGRANVGWCGPPPRFLSVP